MWNWCNLVAKESGLECTFVNNDDSFYQVMGGSDTTEWACVLCGHHIQNDWLSRAMNLYQILRHPWTLRCGNYSDDSEGCSCEQLEVGSFITTTCLLTHHISCRVFWWNIKLLRWLSPPATHLQPIFGALWLVAFPKTKITFEREEISERWWDSGKYNGAADGD